MVVLEDIDSFIDAKTTTLTMSGLLNCLDGLMRGDGLIVVLTANSIEKINVDCHALLRTARIDIALEFTHANEFQTRSAFDHYFPLLPSIKEPADSEWVRFWAVAKPLQYSVAALQQFFFHARGKDSLPVEEFEDIAKGLVPGNKLAFYT
jgi:chaperone BCS1